MNDAILLSIDQVRFLYSRRKRMRIYGIGISADSSGRLIVTEMPSSVTLFHRPQNGRPAIWDFPFSGFTIYQNTAEIPDLVAFHFLIVQDRSRVRRVGDVLNAITSDESSSEILAVAAKQAKDASDLIASVSRSVCSLLEGITESESAVENEIDDKIFGKHGPTQTRVFAKSDLREDVS